MKQVYPYHPWENSNYRKYPNINGKGYLVRHKENKYPEGLYKGVSAYTRNMNEVGYLYHSEFHGHVDDFDVYELTTEEFLEVRARWERELNKLQLVEKLAK